MLPDTTRPTLLARLRDLDDGNAWREFVGCYRELILRHGKRRGLQPAVAEDVRQEVMLALTRRLPSFLYQSDNGRFRDYLGTIVRNAIWARLSARAKTCGTVPLEQQSPEATADRDDQWEHEWVLHHFRRAMACVRANSNEQTMRVFEGLLAGGAPEELARHHGTTTANVYKIKQRIRERLKVEVQRQIDEEELPRQSR